MTGDLAPDFRRLFESVPGLYLVLTPDLMIAAVSDAYLRATMTQRDEILGRALFDVFPDNPDDPTASGVDNLRSSLDRVRQGRTVDAMPVQKYDIRRPESEGGGFEERHWSPVNSPVFDSNGDLVYIIHRVEDVTEFARLNQMRTEHDLATEALRTRAVQMEAEVFARAREVAEVNRRLRTANEELERANEELEAFSYSVSHDLRAPLRSIDGFSQALLEDWSPLLDEKGRHYLHRVRASAQRMGELIDDLLGLSRVSRASLRRAPVNLSALANDIVSDLQRDSGRLVEYLIEDGIEADADRGLMRLIPAIERELRDVAQRRERAHLEEQLRQSQKMEAIGRLAGGVAHDFNNLLTAILGYTELCLDRVQAPADVVDDLEEIRKAGHQASRLTRQLLAFSRKQVLQPQALDVNAIVTDVEKMLRRLIGDDIRFETELSPTLQRVEADPGQLEQVLMNLAVNARDAMSRGGVLTITTANVTLPQELARLCTRPHPAGHIALTVSDNGCGMSPDVRARIFEPFFTTKAPDKGTGLGLSTVYGIVAQSGGHVTVDSEPDRGATFTVYLPAVDAGEPLPSAPPVTTSPSCEGHETILLVDDEPGVCELARKVLQRYGYSVLKTGDATSAMTFARNHPEPIDLLLSDVVMPGLAGPDLAQWVVSCRPDIRVLYMSGYAHRATGFGAMSAHTAFLQKPFTPEELARKVRECLDTSIRS